MPMLRCRDFSAYGLETCPTPSGAPKGVNLSKDDMTAEQLPCLKCLTNTWYYGTMETFPGNVSECSFEQ
jgi:hypothetical protein